MSKQVAIILSGSGVYDGSEIHETVLTLLALEKAKIGYKTFAPNIAQAEVVNHFASEVVPEETRNILVESNRLSRGNTQALSTLNHSDFDALVFVGGFGAAKNLSNFAKQGENYTVFPEVTNCINQFFANKKWILSMCISPVLLAKTIENASITIGSDSATIELLEKATTCHHVKSTVEEYHIDEEHKLITTPAYMLATNLIELEKGISSAIEALASQLSHP